MAWQAYLSPLVFTGPVSWTVSGLYLPSKSMRWAHPPVFGPGLMHLVIQLRSPDSAAALPLSVTRNVKWTYWGKTPPTSKFSGGGWFTSMFGVEDVTSK